jgi:hypothetical protein
MKNKVLVLAALLMASCGHAERVSVPVEVKVPVKTPCGPSGIPAAEARPSLALSNVTDATPIDKDVDWLTASAIQLKAYAMQLERERDALRRYELLCTK